MQFPLQTIFGRCNFHSVSRHFSPTCRTRSTAWGFSKNVSCRLRPTTKAFQIWGFYRNEKMEKGRQNCITVQGSKIARKESDETINRFKYPNPAYDSLLQRKKMVSGVRTCLTLRYPLPQPANSRLSLPTHRRTITRHGDQNKNQSALGVFPHAFTP
jgi:hypothetical protein